MELKKGYKRTEVGVIPEDWTVQPFMELCEKITVGIASAATHAYRSTGVVMLRNQNIKENTLDDSDVLTIDPSFEQLYKTKRLKEGDLLTARTGYPGTTCVVPRKYDGCQSFTTLISRPKKGEWNTQYLSYFINSEIGKSFFEANQIGGGQKNVNATTLKKMPIAGPSCLPEQTAIANALSDVDALISSLEKLIEKKKRIKEGAMQQLLQPKEGWVERRLGDCFSFLKTASFSRSETNDSTGVGYIHYGDIHTKWNFELDLSVESISYIDGCKADSYSYLQDGDLVMADVSEDYLGIGKSVEVKNLGTKKVIAGLHTFLLRDEIQEFVNGFKGYLVLMSSVKRQIDRLATGTKVYGISKTNLQDVIIPIPPKKEQSFTASVLTGMENQIRCLEVKLYKYQKIKQGMMQNLLTGKIRLVKQEETEMEMA